MSFLRIFGKFLISVGVGVLLFVAWTLWGTGIYTSQQQHDLSQEFDGLPSFEDTLPPSNGEPPEPDELIVHGPPADYDPRPGAPVFRLRIPDLDFSKIVVEGVDIEELRKGPGHYPECREGVNPPHCTDYPASWPGDKGRVIVSGHRTTYGAPFDNLDKLGVGDEIVTETQWGTFRYIVTRQEIVDANDLTITQQQQGRREIVLTTCHPKFSASQRLIIFAELEERLA